MVGVLVEVKYTVFVADGRSVGAGVGANSFEMLGTEHAASVNIKAETKAIFFMAYLLHTCINPTYFTTKRLQNRTNELIQFHYHICGFGTCHL